jgi:transcriptional regulator with XRE-family HTH domain
MTAPKTPSIGDIIRTAREDVRFTQTDFACELGLSRRTLSRWESDTTVPGVDEREWIVKCLLGFDRVVGERVASQLGVERSSPYLSAVLSQGLTATATSLGVSQARMTTALAKLVEQWRTHGATIEELARWLGV